MTVLKIDQDARRDDRRIELAKILRDAVWGRTRLKCRLKAVTGGLVRWHVEHNSTDAINDAIATLAEAASLGLIRQAGDYWRPSEEVYRGE